MDDLDPPPDYPGLLRLDGRVLVVLGAGAGIGRQCAHALAQAGATVVCVDREPASAKAVADEVGGHAVTADVTGRAEVTRVFREAAAVGPVTGVVDIVGLAVLRPLLDFDDADYDRQFDVVLRHAFLTLQLGGRAVADAGGGAMVFIGSVSGHTYAAKETVYGAAKAALHRMVESAGRELAPLGVRVNAVAPGFTRTPRLNVLLDEAQWAAVGAGIPRGHAGAPAEIAGPVLFLVSELASYLTGQTITVDGGMTGVLPVPF
ncbi:MAG TPA: SDR family NAD(P)-dependent oxidoreductase [Pseudonocardia sp.]|nr:SDR family NAD(P)-dependent oxidoreductase [Pseudonocardia sp.]